MNSSANLGNSKNCAQRFNANCCTSREGHLRSGRTGCLCNAVVGDCYAEIAG